VKACLVLRVSDDRKLADFFEAHGLVTMKPAMLGCDLPSSIEEAPRWVDENRGVGSTQPRKISHGLRSRLQISVALTTTLSWRPFQDRTFPIWKAHLLSREAVRFH
jgi:hypothetical protein